MKVSLRLLVLILVMSLKSCNSNKTIVEEKPIDESIINEGVNDALIKAGYSFGVISYKRGTNCSYIIIDKETDSNFDPINIQEKQFESFRKDSTKVYYKFRRLRMPYRCDTIQPIELIDIKKEKH